MQDNTTVRYELEYELQYPTPSAFPRVETFTTKEKALKRMRLLGLKYGIKAKLTQVVEIPELYEFQYNEKLASDLEILDIHGIEYDLPDDVNDNTHLIVNL